MSFPCTELLLFNYAKVKTVFHSMAPLILHLILAEMTRFAFKMTTQCVKTSRLASAAPSNKILVNEMADVY